MVYFRGKNDRFDRLAEALSRLHGFSSAAPEGNFILLGETKLMNFVCTKNDGFCINNDAFCAENGGFCVLKMVGFTDMSHNAGSLAPSFDGGSGGGMWRDPWKGSWGIPFIWTALPVSQTTACAARNPPRACAGVLATGLRGRSGHQGASERMFIFHR